MDIINRAAIHVRQLFAGEATGHDWRHIERVWRTATTLGRAESADLTVVQLAALLHDVADWKFHDGDEDAGPRAARAWLSEQGASPEVIAHVCEIVKGVSFKGAGVPTPMRTIEGKVVQDADRLDALGAIGIARAFAYGGYKGQPIFDPATPPGRHASFAEYQMNRGSTINHFHEKRLLLADRMNTDPAKRIARERTLFMRQFLAQFDREWAATIGPCDDLAAAPNDQAPESP